MPRLNTTIEVIHENRTYKLKVSWSGNGTRHMRKVPIKGRIGEAQNAQRLFENLLIDAEEG